MRQRWIWHRDHKLQRPINHMNRIIFALAIIAAVPAAAGEWALVNSSGTVVQVIVANGAAILDRDDGPWIKTGKTKVGIGWIYDGSKFSAPGSTSTFSVANSSGTLHVPPTTKGHSRKKRNH